jgi:hypothetical protein
MLKLVSAKPMLKLVSAKPMLKPVSAGSTPIVRSAGRIVAWGESPSYQLRFNPVYNVLSLFRKKRERTKERNPRLKWPAKAILPGGLPL